MSAALAVQQPGLFTTLQDLGRDGFQDVGVPLSGALDRVALRLANALVGNAPGEAVLEVLVHGPEFEVAADAVRVALAGCDGAIELRGETTRTIAAGRSARFVRGERFRVASLGRSACGCLAVEGGFDVAPQLGSVSTYARAGLGGLHGGVLRAGDRLPLRQAAAAPRAERALAEPFDLELDAPLRVVPGPQADHFTEAARATFLGSGWRVSAQADRMGFRLEGPTLQHARGHDIVSDGIVPGSIQVPGSGLPIVLLADAQTTGGYPKIATLASADLPRLARRRPGAALRFEAAEVDAAARLRRDQEAWLQRCIDALRVVRDAPGIDLDALYASNLVSGVAGSRRVDDPP